MAVYYEMKLNLPFSDSKFIESISDHLYKYSDGYYTVYGIKGTRDKENKQYISHLFTQDEVKTYITKEEFGIPVICQEIIENDVRYYLDLISGKKYYWIRKNGKNENDIYFFSPYPGYLMSSENVAAQLKRLTSENVKEYITNVNAIDDALRKRYKELKARTDQYDQYIESFRKNHGR